MKILLIIFNKSEYFCSFEQLLIFSNERGERKLSVSKLSLNELFIEFISQINDMFYSSILFYFISACVEYFIKSFNLYHCYEKHVSIATPIRIITPVHYIKKIKSLLQVL